MENDSYSSLLPHLHRNFQTLTIANYNDVDGFVGYCTPDPRLEFFRRANRHSSKLNDDVAVFYSGHVGRQARRDVVQPYAKHFGSGNGNTLRVIVIEAKPPFAHRTGRKLLTESIRVFL